MFKRILAVTLSFCIILTLFCGCSMLFNFGKCGKNVVWNLDDEGTLTISGTGPMYDYEDDIFQGPPWDNSKTIIKRVIIKDGVTSIGDVAFDSYEHIVSISIPDSVQSIGDEAFEGCYRLKNVTIPHGVTRIGTWTFSSCSALTSINLPKSVTTIEYGAFSNCYGLKKVIIPDGVTSIGAYAFYNCSNLESVTIPSSVTYIASRAFYLCDSLTHVYYGGTLEQWTELMAKKDSSIDLSNVKKTYKEDIPLE